MSYCRRNNKTSQRVTRADLGIIEVMFVAIEGSWELSQVNRGLLPKALKLQRVVNSSVSEHPYPWSS